MPPPYFALLPENVVLPDGGGALVVESAAVRVGEFAEKVLPVTVRVLPHGVPDTAAGQGGVGVEDTAAHRRRAAGRAGIAIVDAAAAPSMPGVAGAGGSG